MTIAAMATSRGLSRRKNQDRAIYDIESGIFVLADGFGGTRDGGVASEIAVTVSFREARRRIEKRPARTVIRECILKANNAILEHARLTGARMGSTILMVIVHGPKLYVGYVGDTKSYLLRRRRLVQLTVEHTLASELRTAGLLNTSGTDPSHANHILTRSLGQANARPNISMVDLRPEDIIILCTDGVNVLPDDEIERLCVSTVSPPRVMARKLVQASRVAGGLDDATAVIAQVQ